MKYPNVVNRPNLAGVGPELAFEVLLDRPFAVQQACSIKSAADAKQHSNTN